MMSSLASFVVRRRRAVITFWIGLLLGTATVGSAAFSVLSSDFGAGPGTESAQVTERLDDLAETGGEIAIIANGIDIEDPATAAALTEGLQRVAAIDGVVAVVDPWSTASNRPSATSPPESSRESSPRAAARAGELPPRSPGAFPPSSYAPSVVGTRYLLTAT